MPNWISGTIVKKDVWTEGLFTLHLRCDGVKDFAPGQFLHLALTHEEKRINRPYSVASPFGDVIEFFIVQVEDGELTPKLWKLEPGSKIEVSEKAAGRFTLEKTPDAECLWLVGTGTGLAPYIAMLRTDGPWERFKKIVLVHGVRYAADLAYTEEMKQLTESRAGQFSFVQALTREESEGTLHGRIPALVESGELEKAAGCELTATTSSILLCGNPAMLDTMEEVLAKRDMKRHKKKDPGQIVVERYW
jgi:ferredoxin--NADP+ reductase